MFPMYMTEEINIYIDQKANREKKMVRIQRNQTRNMSNLQT